MSLGISTPLSTDFANKKKCEKSKTTTAIATAKAILLQRPRFINPSWMLFFVLEQVWQMSCVCLSL